MTIRPICITGEPVLHTRAKEVETFDQELRNLVEDMFETMDKAPGVGLAAPQIGVGLRIFTYDYADDEGKERRGVIINPVLEIGPIVDEPADEDTEIEGCLSVPGERFPLKRAEKAIITGLDLDQQPVHIEAEGWPVELESCLNAAHLMHPCGLWAARHTAPAVPGRRTPA